jgi:hypothetical protein
METKRQDLFATIRTEGAILPPDLLQRIADADADLGGLSPSDYHLSGEKLNEAINRSWNRLIGAWVSFKTGIAAASTTDPGTGLTREKWLFPLCQELGYGRLTPAKAVEVEGKAYPISHRWLFSPIHLIGFRVDLDHRSPGVAGAARSSPHSLVQELLNRAPEMLWGFVSNGMRLRILRDNKSLVRQTYAEFDLQAMFDGQVYPDFKLLWMLCHQSRVEGERPELCWLEKWSQAAAKEGTRALDSLRDGVQSAIEHLGTGFIAHPDNAELRDRLRTGNLHKQDYYRQLLRLVYRLIFLFVAEDRGQLFAPGTDPAAQERYTRYYSTRRLRGLAARLRGTPHADLWRGITVVFTKLDRTGCRQLGLPAFGSFLWSPAAVDAMGSSQLSNRHLLDAVRALAFTVDSASRRPVDYRNLGSEELGSIYESLLELHPRIELDAQIFQLGTAAGHERKTTGSYYTPTSLVNCLLDAALEPLLDEAVRGGEGFAGRGESAAQRILSLKVCDPACGSGHFLIAAAHRIAKRLASVQTGDEEPSPDAQRRALRQVIGHCVYGVDLTTMAVELCKVSLWMEALEPGKPLSFLDHRVQSGNSLIGATPALLSHGVPDAAFDAIEGDDKAICRTFKKQNKDERKGQLHLFGGSRPWEQLGNLAITIAQLDAVSDETLDGVRVKQRSYEEIVRSGAYENGWLLADAWCASFMWRKTRDFDYPITQSVLDQIHKNPHGIAPWLKQEIRRLAGQYQFFHWHLAFPDVFRSHKTEPSPDDPTGWTGGFWNQMSEYGWVRPVSEGTVPAPASVTPEVREIDRAELDALVAWDVFRLTEAELSNVMDSFPVLRRRELSARGEFRTKRLVMEAYVGRVRQSDASVPAASVELRKETVQIGRVVVFLILLLNKWVRPVHRPVLESALILMLNAPARKVLSGQKASRKAAKRLEGPPRCMAGMDGLLAALQRNGVIEVTTGEDRQAVKLTQNAPISGATKAPQAAHEAAAETIAVLEKLDIAEVMAGIEETVDAEYIFV